MRSGALSYNKLAAAALCAVIGLSASCTHHGHNLESDAKHPKPVNVASPAGVAKIPFGSAQNGERVDLYTLTNKRGAVAKIMTRGATLTELWMPDKQGKLEDVVLGFETLAEYEQPGNPYFGATVGRYANRIAGGKFTLDGKEYSLFVNNGPNSLHGGKVGFDKRIWTSEAVTSPDGPAVKFTCESKDGEEGYPGNLTVTVVYTLTQRNALKIEYTATTDADTVLNLTNHSYYNLGGAGNGTVLDHIATFKADHYTPFDEAQIPTGEIAPVKGTPMDFSAPTAIGDRIRDIGGPPPGGYDHNYVINGSPGVLRVAAKVKDPKSGRVLEVSTTEPGVQFYTGNHLNGKVKGIGGLYPMNAAFCLETQHYPDSPNHPKFPTTELKPGQTYRQQTVMKFSAE